MLFADPRANGRVYDAGGGADEDATAQNLDAIANIGFIVGKDAVLVTDAGGSLVDGRWLRAQIKARTDKPIRYVVISHVHPDHAFGAGAFAEDKPTYIGHAKLPEALGARGPFYKKGLADIIGAASLLISEAALGGTWARAYAE